MDLCAQQTINKIYVLIVIFKMIFFYEIMRYASDYYHSHCNNSRRSRESYAFPWWLIEYPMWITPFCERFSVLFEPAFPLCLTNTGSDSSFILHLFGLLGFRVDWLSSESRLCPTFVMLRPRKLASEDKTLVFILLSSPQRKLDSHGNSQTKRKRSSTIFSVSLQ